LVAKIEQFWMGKKTDGIGTENMVAEDKDTDSNKSEVHRWIDGIMGRPRPLKPKLTPNLNPIVTTALATKATDPRNQRSRPLQERSRNKLTHNRLAVDLARSTLSLSASALPRVGA
jgi:hypothetical protein